MKTYTVNGQTGQQALGFDVAAETMALDALGNLVFFVAANGDTKPGHVVAYVASGRWVTVRERV